MAVSSNMDWKLCVICQTNSSEELRCPSLSLDPIKIPPVDVYESFLDNVEEFRKLNSLPVDFPLGVQETAPNLVEKMLHGINDAIRSSILRCWSVPSKSC